MRSRNRAEWGYESYLKFSLVTAGEVPGTTILKLFGNNPNNNNTVKVGIFGTSDDWEEDSITWNNAPAADPEPIVVVEVDGTETYYEFDITSYVQEQAATDGIVSLVVKSLNENADRARFNAKEFGSHIPELLVTCDNNGGEVARKRTFAPQDNWKLYPNPTSDAFTLSFGGDIQEAVSLRIMDLSGKVILAEKVNGDVFRNGKKINLANVPVGMYVVNIEFDGYQVSKQLVKSN